MWFIGHTLDIRDVANKFEIRVKTLYRIICRLVTFISSMSPHVITWPNDDEKEDIATAFAATGFPNVIGIVGGCHIRLDKPAEDPKSYINRKGYYSIQVLFKLIIKSHSLVLAQKSLLYIFFSRYCYILVFVPIYQKWQLAFRKPYEALLRIT